jgi:hypothetical protein
MIRLVSMVFSLTPPHPALSPWGRGDNWRPLPSGRGLR